MTYKKRKEKRIILDVNPGFHTAVKVRAGIRNITMKDYIIMCIGMFFEHYERIPVEDKDQK